MKCPITPRFRVRDPKEASQARYEALAWDASFPEVDQSPYERISLRDLGNLQSTKNEWFSISHKNATKFDVIKVYHRTQDGSPKCMSWYRVPEFVP